MFHRFSKTVIKSQNRRMSQLLFTQWASSGKVDASAHLLFTSTVIATPPLAYEVQVYTNCLAISKDDGYVLPFTFDLRFSTDINSVKFVCFEEEVELELPKGDGAIWREQLAPYLNQAHFQTHYRAKKKIGKGTFASVYLVQKIVDGNLFAVKAFSKEAAYSEKNGKDCLMKEIEIMRGLQFPNVLRLHEVYESDCSLYLVFELLKGGSLEDRLKAKQRFSALNTQTVIRGLLKGLMGIHSQGVMHRDIKPENLLFRTEDSYDCMIADFGLAEFVDAEEYLFVRCGTPGFVAPEVINIKDKKTRYGSVCDIFSLGLIFHRMLVGKGLFEGKSCDDVLDKNRACAVNLQGQAYSQIHPVALDLLKRMLEISPGLRITAKQALEHEYLLMKLEGTEEQPIAQPIAQPIVQPIEPVEKKKYFRPKKDSCLVFNLGKEPVMTGKTETVGNLNSGQRLSGFGLSLLKDVKISKFTKDNIKEEGECEAVKKVEGEGEAVKKIEQGTSKENTAVM